MLMTAFHKGTKVIDYESIDDQAALFRVLADPTRLKLLRLLAQQREPSALCVNALACRLGVTQSAVSQHLRVLKSAGLVKGERRGYRIHYFINQETLIQAQQRIFSALRLEEKVAGGDGPEK
jgi:ArsR family transcriptional regulator